MLYLCCPPSPTSARLLAPALAPPRLPARRPGALGIEAWLGRYPPEFAHSSWVQGGAQSAKRSVGQRGALLGAHRGGRALAQSAHAPTVLPSSPTAVRPLARRPPLARPHLPAHLPGRCMHSQLTTCFRTLCQNSPPTDACAPQMFRRGPRPCYKLSLLAHCTELAACAGPSPTAARRRPLARPRLPAPPPGAIDRAAPLH